jgi:hypothetical protein
MYDKGKINVLWESNICEALRIFRLRNILDGRFEVFTAVIMKNGVIWDVTP